MAERLDPAILEAHARVCRTMAHPVRLALLNALREGERNVGDLAQALDAPQPQVSQHLAVLRNAGLLRSARNGNEIYYHIAYPKMVQACDLLREVLFEHIRSQNELLNATPAQEGEPMAEVRGFLGRDFVLPEDRLYDPSRHFWLQMDAEDGGTVTMGVSEPGVALTGGLIDLDVFPEAGDELVVDQEVAFATTYKNMKYFLSPIPGRTLEINEAATAESVSNRPFETWLVRLEPAPGWDARLLDAAAYTARLAGSEHATPEAVRAASAGKSSPTCKSVYGGIKEA